LEAFEGMVQAVFVAGVDIVRGLEDMVARCMKRDVKLE
jgi:hypothetical protein